MNIVKRVLSLFSKGDDRQKVPCTKKDNIVDKILLCAKGIINNGDVVQDNASGRNIPSVMFRDSKGNTLYISWFYGSTSVLDMKINGAVVTDNFDAEIFRMAQKRIQVLRKEHLERVVAGVK